MEIIYTIMEDWSEKNKKEIQILKKKAYLVGSILGCVVGVLGIIITIDGYFELGFMRKTYETYKFRISDVLVYSTFLLFGIVIGYKIFKKKIGE